jgi:hypothetical protein
LLFKKLNDLYVTNKKFNDLLMYFAYFFLILNDIYVKLLQFIFFEHHHIGNYMHCTTETIAPIQLICKDSVIFQCTGLNSKEDKNSSYVVHNSSQPQIYDRDRRESSYMYNKHA